MAFKISFKPIALFEVDETIVWYEGELKGLGKKFLDAFSETLDKIKANPLTYSLITKDVRRAIVKSFPYKILFIVEGNDIIILALIHFRRSKKYVRKRLR